MHAAGFVGGREGAAAYLRHFWRGHALGTGFSCDTNFQKADVGETRYAREPLRNRVRRAKQRNLVGPKQRGAGGRVREGREPRVGEPVGFCDANF